MRPIHPLVPEVVADLVDALEPTDEESLEVELVGDAEVERHVEGVVMRHERPRGGPAIQRLEDRRLHLQEPALVEELPEPGDGARPEAEDLAHFRVHRQVRVALAVAQLRIGQPAEGDRLPRFRHLRLAAWKRPERLGEEFNGGHPDGDFPGPGAEELPVDADVVVQVEQLHQSPGSAERVLPEVELEPPGNILDVGEGRLPLASVRHQAAGHRDVGAIVAHGVVIGRDGGGGGKRPLERVAKWLDPGGTELVELGAARLLHERAGLIRHAAVPPAPFRYASMNSSMSPSITLCTSVSFNSVRWSLAIV